MNASLMQAWLSITSKFDALNKRERWLVFAALVFVVYSVINLIFLSPVLEKKKTLTQQMLADQTQVQTLQQQITIMNSQGVIDPDAQNKQRIAELSESIKLQNDRLNGLQSTLISPEKMPELLRSLLKKNGKLKLIALKTLPATGLLQSTQNSLLTSTSKTDLANQAPAEMKPVLEEIAYKHGVELTVEGRYLDLLQYVADLENSPWHLLLSKAELNAEKFPNSQFKLTIFTLSLDKTWLSI